MKMIPMPEPGDKVSYLGEGEVEHGKVVESDEDMFDGGSWQVEVEWEGSREGLLRSFAFVDWNDELKLWITT